MCVRFLQSNTPDHSMKLLGGNDDGGGRGPPGRTQDDAAVGYEFQRHPHEPEFSQFSHKQPRWATGEEALIDVCFFCAILPNHCSIYLFICCVYLYVYGFVI